MKKWLINGAHGANLVGLGAQILQFVPQKPWVMVLQAAISAFLPSLGGIGHKMVFGNNQDPEDK